jgi:hypothetical protein
MTANFHEEEFVFRFIHLSPTLNATIRTNLSGMEIQCRRPDVLAVSLNSTTDLRPLYALLLSEEINNKHCGLWISLVSSSDHDGLDLPDYILDFVYKSRCSVAFSFVSCLDNR